MAVESGCSITALQRITGLKIELEKDSLKKQARRPGFVLDVKHDELNTRFYDMRLSKLLPIYDSIVAHRPDLRIV